MLTVYLFLLFFLQGVTNDIEEHFINFKTNILTNQDVREIAGLSIASFCYDYNVIHGDAIPARQYERGMTDRITVCSIYLTSIYIIWIYFFSLFTICFHTSSLCAYISIMWLTVLSNGMKHKLFTQQRYNEEGVHQYLCL